MRKIVAILVVLLAFACSSDDSSTGGGSTGDSFDRTAMLTNWADNIIIPAYQDFAGDMTSLKTAATTFTSAPDVTNLNALRIAWYNAYKTWQQVELFNIGKAEEITYSFYMNVYPVNTAEVDSNITNGGYDLNAIGSQDAVGFAAIDYLIYGLSSNDADIVAYYTGANGTSYQTYLNDVVNQMDSLTQQVLNDWTTTYRDVFVSNSGNTVTSSVNKLINDFIFYYEKGLRANKVGIPAGVWSATSLPEKVEARFRGNISRELTLDGLAAVQNFFNGKHYNSSLTGESMKSYLDFLNTIKDGEDLSALISNQLGAARTKILSLNQNFETQINTDNTQMTQAYDELQMAVVLIKVDMLQAFNIAVDYVDADGD